jgi:hypothetical protein
MSYVCLKSFTVVRLLFLNCLQHLGDFISRMKLIFSTQSNNRLIMSGPDFDISNSTKTQLFAHGTMMQVGLIHNNNKA